MRLFTTRGGPCVRFAPERLCRLLLSADSGVPLRGFRLWSRFEGRVSGDPVQERQQLAHGRDDGPLVRMSLGPFPAVVAAEDRVPHDRRDRRHVERVAHASAPAPYPPLPFLRPALPLLRRDADEPVELLVGEFPDLGEPGEDRDRRDVPDAADLREPPAEVVHGPVLRDGLKARALNLRDELVEVPDLLPYHRTDARVGLRLEPAGQDGARVNQRLAEPRPPLELDRLDVGGGERAHAYLVGEAGYQRRVDLVVFGETALGPCELANAQGVGIRDGDAELVHEGDELQLVASGRLHADRGLRLSRQVAERPEPRDAVVQQFRLRTPPALRRDVDVELLLGNINSDVHGA